jgi:phenol 2-monooxygenase
MQFHLNGFRPGDPNSSQFHHSPAERARSPGRPTKVDVLIIGSGPSGLTLAAQLSQFPEIRTRIVEQKPGPLRVGQADGIACRTMEMFEAFGFCERVLREAYWVNETCFWRPDEKRPERIVRGRVIQDVEEGLSEFPHVILNQARVHDFYLELMHNAPAPLEPEYSTRLINLQIDSDLSKVPTAYPVTVTLERTDGLQPGTVDVVQARYVVGCDGARSAVRQLMGLSLEGDSASQAWGVMDVLAVTDFPDVRRKTAIHSAEEGSLLIIPREGGYLVRLYIELGKLGVDQRVSHLDITSDRLVDAARRILNPFTLEVREIAWWSVYEIGHRLCERFDDLQADGDDDAGCPRVFVAGDACHTHSPKAGQGMNVSMQDAFNLGWKLASVLQGRTAPQVLTTYNSERHAIAKELIDFDREFARMFSARPKTVIDADDAGVDPQQFQAYFVRAGRFTAGTATRYRPSVLTGGAAHQERAKGFIVGTRFHSAPVIRMADSKPMHLGHTNGADGRWRIFAFADSRLPNDRSSPLWAFCEFVERSPDSPIRRYTPPNVDIDSVIELIAICQQTHSELSVDAMPPILLPRKGRFNLIDYEKIFCPDTKAENNIFGLRGIDRQRGALVIVRPDQYVGLVLPLEAHAELAAYFQRFMLDPPVPAR